MQIFAVTLLLATTVFASPAVFPTQTGHTVTKHHDLVHKAVHQTVARHHIPVYSKTPVQHFQHVAPIHHTSNVNVNARHDTNVGEVPVARILNQDAQLNPDGSYINVWNSDNGISVQEEGYVKRVNDANVVVAGGNYAYTDDDGQQYRVSYTADENGFQPHGEHLPTPPPIPVAIVRSLEYIAAHPYVETTTEFHSFGK